MIFGGTIVSRNRTFKEKVVKVNVSKAEFSVDDPAYVYGAGIAKGVFLDGRDFGFQGLAFHFMRIRLSIVASWYCPYAVVSAMLRPLRALSGGKMNFPLACVTCCSARGMSMFSFTLRVCVFLEAWDWSFRCLFVGEVRGDYFCVGGLGGMLFWGRGTWFVGPGRAI